jgi:hypothetical protein
MRTTLPLIAIFAAILVNVLSLAAEPLSPLTKAEQLIVPKLSFKKATVHEAAKFLTRMSRNLDPAKTGVAIVFAAPAADETRISLELANISVAGAAKKIAEAAKLELRVEGESIVLRSTLPGGPKPAEPTNKEIPGLGPGTQIPGLDPVPNAKPVAPTN